MFIVLHRASGELPEQFQVAKIDRYRDEDGGSIIFHGNDFTNVRETPAEIAALIAAEQRKRDRLMLAGQALQGYLANPNVSRWIPHEIAGQAAQSADALLAALDAREGAE